MRAWVVVTLDDQGEVDGAHVFGEEDQADEFAVDVQAHTVTTPAVVHRRPRRRSRGGPD